MPPKTKNYAVISRHGDGCMVVKFYYLKSLAEEFAMGHVAQMKAVKPVNEEEESLRDWLSFILKKKEVSLTFEKKDGTIREMRCTLNENVVPPYEKKTTRTRASNDAVLSVFDLDKNEWRSFRVESVRKVNFEL